jgi:Mrp family chromosome partitioning ATPase
MNMTPGRPWHADGSVPPVILPIGAPRGSEWETLPDLSPGGEAGAVQVSKFTFPAIGARCGEALLEDLPYAIWPKCECTEAVQAGIRLAKAVRGRLPSDRPSVVAFTSASDGDGKTTLVEILAPELAKRTSGGALVVDADFRKSDLTARLAISTGSNSAGSSVIYPTDLAGLNVLPMSRQRQSRGADAGWIEGMREGWPLTILDMASLAHRETAPVLRYCDGVCLVVRLGHTPRRAVNEAARIITRCGGQFLGCVVVGDAA